MGAEPVTALNIVGFPRATMPLDVLTEVLNGGAERVREAGAVVIGGHSIIDPELKFGLAVTGTVHPRRIIRNVGIRPGDALVLTKPLGTGIVTTALKRRAASAASVRDAVASMVSLNKTASTVMKRFPIHACSDVTGYGILGHSYEMASGSGVTVTLEAATFPTLRGAARLAGQGHVTGGCARNRAYLAGKVEIAESLRPEQVEIAFDPQTSGGLLIALPSRAATRLVKALQSAGIPAAAVVGRATARRRGSAYVRLVS